MSLFGFERNLRTAVRDHQADVCNRRRQLLTAGAGLIGAAVLSPAALAANTVNRDRMLTFYNPHTGETSRLIYWTPIEGHIDQSITEFSWLMRDHRRDEMIKIDVGLLDQLYWLQQQLDYRQPIHTISGYRSPKTNAELRAHNKRVAKNSFHMKGMAVDIRMPGREVNQLHKAALSLKAGGVGYYPRSNFVHIDTGSIRNW